MSTYEKRRSKRYPIDLKLEISSLFKQDNVRVNHIDAPIEVVNISKMGIGFQSKCQLPIDFYFNAKLTLGDSDSNLYAVVRIMRIEKIDSETYMYGSEFIGLAPVLSYIFDEYEEKLNEAQEDGTNSSK